MDVSQRVKPGGRLFISIYNDQGGISRYWTAVKACTTATRWRALLIAVYTPYFIAVPAHARLHVVRDDDRCRHRSVQRVRVRARALS
jgi:hypothetical protein